MQQELQQLVIMFKMNCIKPFISNMINKCLNSINGSKSSIGCLCETSVLKRVAIIDSRPGAKTASDTKKNCQSLLKSHK